MADGHDDQAHVLTPELLHEAFRAVLDAPYRTSDPVRDWMPPEPTFEEWEASGG